MSTPSHLYVLIFDDESATTTRGSDARSAIVDHFDDMNMFCAPDKEYSTEFPVVALQIPESIADEIEEFIEDHDIPTGYEMAVGLKSKYLDIVETRFQVTCSGADTEVSQPDIQPDIFEGLI